MAIALAGSLLLSKEVRIGKFSRPLLSAALAFNIAAMAVNACVSANFEEDEEEREREEASVGVHARPGRLTRPPKTAFLQRLSTPQEIWEYMLSQDRSSDKLNAYILADCLAPLFQGLTAAMCQTFMGIRCVKISGRSVLLLVGIVAGILTSLGGAIWLTVANLLYRANKLGPEGLLVPTEVWLWSAVATDLTLTVFLTWSLRRMRKGFNQSWVTSCPYVTSLFEGSTASLRSVSNVHQPLFADLTASSPALSVDIFTLLERTSSYPP